MPYCLTYSTTAKRCCTAADIASESPRSLLELTDKEFLRVTMLSPPAILGLEAALCLIKQNDLFVCESPMVLGGGLDTTASDFAEHPLSAARLYGPTAFG